MPDYGASEIAGLEEIRYTKMRNELDEIPIFHNIFAIFFTWLLLAGYIIFPATFTSLKKSSVLSETGVAGQAVLVAVQNTRLLVLASICYITSICGLLYLWWRWRHNYIWLLNRIFL